MSSLTSTLLIGYSIWVMGFFPKKIDFFSLLGQAMLNANVTTGNLVEMLENYVDLEEKVREIHELEHQGDMLTHDVIRKLNQTFITPIDREDIHALAAALDDVVDMVWAFVDRMIIFKIEKPTHESIFLARELHETTRFMIKAFKELESKKYEYVKEHCIEINRMENRIDRIYRNALGELFDDFADDPIMVIKWKDLYYLLESAANKCEDVANVLEGIVLKHA